MRTRDPTGSSDAVNVLASGPKHSMGEFGFFVSGVSMPIRRTRSSRPPMSTSIVSPSTTWVTVAVPVPGPGSAPVQPAIVATTQHTAPRWRTRLFYRHERRDVAGHPFVVHSGCDAPPRTRRKRIVQVLGGGVRGVR